MQKNASLLAKIGPDTAENEQHVAEILPTDALWRRRHAETVVEHVKRGLRMGVEPVRDRLDSGRSVEPMLGRTQLSN